MKEKNKEENKIENKIRVPNKIDEWDSTSEGAVDKFNAAVSLIEYSATINGMKIGFSSIKALEEAPTVIEIRNVLLGYSILVNDKGEEVSDGQFYIQKFFTYRKLFLIGSTIVFPS